MLSGVLRCLVVLASRGGLVLCCVHVVRLSARGVAASAGREGD
jgi:hypothetical protein